MQGLAPHDLMDGSGGGGDGAGGSTAECLLKAVRLGQLDTLRALLRRGISSFMTFAVDGHGPVERALGLAVACGQQGALSVLMEHDVDPATTDREGQTLLHLAARRIATICAKAEAQYPDSNASAAAAASDAVNTVLGCTQVILERLRSTLPRDALHHVLDALDAEVYTQGGSNSRTTSSTS